MSFLEINKSESSNINKSFNVNVNLITHFVRNDTKEEKCFFVNLNDLMLTGYTTENINRTFNICEKDNMKSMIKLNNMK